MKRITQDEFLDAKATVASWGWLRSDERDAVLSDAALSFCQQIGPIRSPARWLVAASKKWALNLLRVAKKQSRDKLRLDQVRQNDRRRNGRAFYEEPCEATSNGAMVKAVNRALSGLPERHREAIILCDLHGLTPTEAARELRVPRSTVKSWLKRARMQLACNQELRSLILSDSDDNLRTSTD